MAISKNTQANIDDSNPTAYPNGQVKDDDGTGDGFPLIQVTMSDHFEFFDKLMRQAGLTFNTEFDNEVNGYQLVQACSALASKSDYILPLTTSSGVLQIPTALQILQLNEKLVCQAGANLTTETTIKGTGPTALNVTRTSVWKNGDYLLLIKISGGVQIIRLVTADNLDVITSENAYLKASSDVTELAGTATDSATTPESNLYAFTQRVTDPTEAAPFLATGSTPGLLSAADKTAIDGFISPVKNVGTFSGVNPGNGTIGSFAPRSGDVTTAQVSSVESGSPGSTTFLVTVANAMSGTNYFVRSSIQSAGTMNFDNDIGGCVYSPQSSTTFLWSLQALISSSKSLIINIEVVQM